MKDPTLLYRQVNPSWIQQDRVTSQSFTTPKDGKKLSVYDGDQISAEESWNHFAGQGHQSVGVLGVTVAECKAQDLDVRPDPEPFEEHVVIDYSSFGTSKIEKIAKRLKVRAEARGWCWRAE